MAQHADIKSAGPAPISKRDIQTEIDNEWTSLLKIFDGLRAVTTPGTDEPIKKSPTRQERAGVEGLGVPGPPHPISQVIEEAYTIFDYRLRLNDPSCFEFIPSSSSQLAWLADVLVSAFNANAAGSFTAAVPWAVENALVGWLASKVHFPPTAGGIFTSGGSMANMMAIAIARDTKIRPSEFPKATMYVSDQTHFCLSKAVKVLGFQEHQIKTVTSDSSYRMNIESLRTQVIQDRDNGMCPFLVVASFGCTVTGAIDSIEKIAEVAYNESLWLHVDGAYGASAALSRSRPEIATELEGADSIAWDGHKWLFQTYGCGMLLVREKCRLLSSFQVQSSHIDYLAQNDSEPELYDMGLELTRPARAMSLWFTLRTLGIDRVGALIDHGIDLAEMVQGEVKQLPGWEILTPATLAIINFRYRPGRCTEEQLNKVNSEVSQRLMASNTAAIMTVKLRGKVALRMCCINTRIGCRDVKRLVYVLNNTARSALEDMVLGDSI
ncbi:pyridoxal phosphate-dependent transferase [Aspergillus avenaceus]|uniref:Pyridoxal phosphate-dependent transferase n=1 Tax=Aspergillus avenaceus TaxID=36643 RepID=A0A5N6U569_ASPAV|nr:pyridoxal phosphate-dependent transferase [Aspergillus avenaceus]